MTAYRSKPVVTAEEVLRQIAELDFEPSEQFAVADMANVGYALMHALPEGYSYNDCPSEIVCDLLNQIADLKATPSAALSRLSEIAAHIAGHWPDDPADEESIRRITWLTRAYNAMRLARQEPGDVEAQYATLGQIAFERMNPGKVFTHLPAHEMDRWSAAADAVRVAAPSAAVSAAEPDDAEHNRIYAIVRGTGYVTRGQADEIAELLLAPTQPQQGTGSGND